MALDWAVRNKRIAAAAVAPVALGAAAVIAVAVSEPSAPSTAPTTLTASVTECHDMVSIAVGGRNDSPRPGTHAMLLDADGNPLPAASSTDFSSPWVDEVVNAPRDDVPEGSYSAVYVEYPANMSSYDDAVETGVDNAQTVMQAIREACPDTKFAVVGYSEGADVARRVAMEIGNQEVAEDGSYEIVDPDSVVGVVILADAGREAGEGPFPGAEDEFRNPDGFDLAYQSGRNSASGSGSLPGTSGSFGALDGKVASFCSEGDLTCSAPENIALLQLAVNVGRQLNVDALEREGLTPQTALDVATVLGRIAMAAFADIQSQENWMQSDETFLDVLIKVSDPSYEPAVRDVASDGTDDEITSGELIDLAYLPAKLRNEVIGFLADNENTLEVALSDPYQQTLGPDTGHHFDYWRDSDPENGKPLTSAQYAAAWLTHLAKQAESGELDKAEAESTAPKLVVSSKPIDPAPIPPTADEDAEKTAAEATTSAPTTTSRTPAATTTTAASPAPVQAPVPAPAAAPAPTTTTPSPVPSPAVQSPAPAVEPLPPVESTTTESSAPETTTPAATTTATTTAVPQP
ncbi:cutinase family protein [Rhodococcus ruber]|uniref:cutinase family protein n=1 Tax=Rhodococcus ruber TaxID=1830 RepID=UPI000EBDCBF8|nr:cutinase family protein [Rhodococcus ruber]QDC16765.1 cutinase family protein [Rhodococcus ruber]RIK09683.1 MAG: cutinase [Acidobacteriota bacterium]